ncbi:sigma-70 family RNA polymerase sigma factor [Virgisporangium ochraceum]|uniref:DNA-directed RNA polymerase sigma-70 factor n=1 Tax=Virgisporangium ochraceum TaxID=65505 RepID=A0A8J4EDD6_9ACTN|nr:sigma-70 family RNA polymerase sigma factor [Virgisporangium ochraceum]GIJ67842.1 DNA-directed RNA polymerase sigma-70 factor [Virgisporangium ochraceum]
MSATTSVESRLEEYRSELTGYCYRMLGSAFEAEDAVQETMVRAWKAYDRFEGRSALRSWLYRIATNVCLDMLGSVQRRARPMDLGPAGDGHATHPGEPLPEEIWIGPVPDERVLPQNPANVVAGRESIRLAFVSALQNLPPKQRAVLILREVLAWSAQEVAELLDTSVPSVNSALQRARATLASPAAPDVLKPLDDGQKALLKRYVEAFEAYDITALTALLHEDATLSMPPLPLWLRGRDDIAAWMLGTGSVCRNSRLVPLVANGMPAFGQYHDGGDVPWAVIVLETSGGRITGINNFLDTDRLFPLFGLPERFGQPQ